MNEVPHPGFEPAKKYETFVTPNNYVVASGFNFADKMTFCGTVDGEQQIVEFIRKDALLEWAKEELLKLQALSNNDAVHWGQANAFKQNID